MFTNWLTNSSDSTTTMVLPPPDIILDVGPSPTVRFVAHSVVLSMHSGYMRSVIRLEENSHSPEFGPIVLTNITAEQFGPLLSYMYTGYLDLNVDNIFGILLATHVLHMPSAMEMCRSFLFRVQSEGYLKENSINTSTQVIRPIPSKAPIPNVGFVAAPMQPVNLLSTGTPFKSIKTFKIDDVKNQETDVEVSISTNLTNLDEETSKMKKQQQHSTQQQQPLIRGKAIVDVASCDGPVRFRRVLNETYGTLPSEAPILNQPTKESVSLSFHQQMAKAISQTQRLADECENSEYIGNNKRTSGDTFKCIYCKHTFKSQYCYQKHTKRHLNSMSLLDNNKTSTSAADDIKTNNEKIEKASTTTTAAACNNKQVIMPAKREVRALDMNVQYYPCKTCGSKFPSYYFVHKHRKMFHSEEETSSDQQNH